MLRILTAAFISCLLIPVSALSSLIYQSRYGILAMAPGGFEKALYAAFWYSIYTFPVIFVLVSLLGGLTFSALQKKGYLNAATAAFFGIIYSALSVVPSVVAEGDAEFYKLVYMDFTIIHCCLLGMLGGILFWLIGFKSKTS